MDLNTVWFVLVTVLFIGFFFLEGFDYGVGTILPFVARKDDERRMVINSIGPFWDGNEVWLLTAGGAIFAAFPHWYATLFSGFYLALLLILVALIVRGVGFEFRSKVESPIWKSIWDWGIFAGSALPSFLWGVAVGNLIRGVPIDETMTYSGGFWNLLNPYSMVTGLTFLTLFAYHGSLFLSLKTTGNVLEKVKSLSSKLWLATVVLAVIFLVYSAKETGLYSKGAISWAVCIAAAVVLIGSGGAAFVKKFGISFILSSLTIVLVTVAAFLSLFPNVFISTTNPEWSLTIYNASSSQYTLTVMTIVAVIFVPLVLFYQAWSYWILRKRISGGDHLEY